MSRAAVRIDNPFPGLRPFREDEEYLFFGREEQVDSMVDKLGAAHLLAVVGTSGSGKSSLVNCGLRPALRRGYLAKAGTAWRMAQFRPGGNPIRALAQALAQKQWFPDYRARGLPLVDLVETTLRMGKKGLLDIFAQTAPAPGQNLLVVVDQFEELFRFRRVGGAGRDSGDLGEQAAAFVNLLLEVKAQTELPIYVVLTMRSDFLGDCTQFPGLAEAVNAGQYLVPRLTRSERKAAIRGPIHVAGSDVSPVLLTRLVNDVGDNPDQLSILQHALNRTWAEWQRQTDRSGVLDLPHYTAIGTMQHALDAHADEAYDSLPEHLRPLCEKMFRALTDKATDARGVRRPTRFATLCALVSTRPALVRAAAGDEAVAAAETTAEENTAEENTAEETTAEGTDAEEITAEEIAELTAVIDVFRDPSRSFLMPPAGEPLAAESVIDISHESLMRVWQRLDRWATAEAESARKYRRLAETAILHRQDDAALLQDPDLQVALDWRRGNAPNARWAAQYTDLGVFTTAMQFLDDSEAAVARAAEQARLAHEAARRRRRNWVIFAIVATAVIVVTLLWAWLHAETVLERNDRNLERMRDAGRLMRDDSRLAAQQLLALEKPMLDSVEAEAADTLRSVLHRGLRVRQSHDGPLVHAAIDANGRHVVAGDTTGAVVVWPTDGGGETARAERPSRCASVAAAGDRAFAGFADGSLLELAWPDTNARIRELASAGGGAVVALATTEHDGLAWVAAACADGRLRVFGLEADSPDPFESVAKQIPSAWRCVAFSPQGTRMAAGATDGTVVVLRQDPDAKRWSVLWSSEPDGKNRHRDRVVTARFAADGDSLLTTSWDGSARIWRIDGPDGSAADLRHSGPVLDAAWAADGTAIVTAGEEGAIVWREQRGDRKAGDRPGWIRAASLDGHVGAVMSAMFQPRSGDDVASERIVTAGEDGHLRVFEWTRGQDARAASPPRLVLDAGEHRGPLLSARCDATGDVLVSCGQDHDVRVWRPLPSRPEAGYRELVASPGYDQLDDRLQGRDLPPQRADGAPGSSASALRQIVVGAQQIGEVAAAAMLLEDLAARAVDIETRARELLYEPYRVDRSDAGPTPTEVLAQELQQLQAQLGARRDQSEFLGQLLAKHDDGLLAADRHGELERRLEADDFDGAMQPIAEQVARRHDLAQAWQQLQDGDCATATLAEWLRDELDPPEPLLRSERVEADRRPQADVSRAPAALSRGERQSLAALRTLRGENQQSLVALRAAFALANRIEAQLAGSLPSAQNWQTPVPTEPGSVALEYQARLLRLTEIANGEGAQAGRAVSERIGALPDERAQAAVTSWWQARLMAIVTAGAGIFATELEQLRDAAKAAIAAANALPSRPGTRRDKRYLRAEILVGNFDAARTAVSGVLGTQLVARFEVEQPLTDLRGRLRDLDVPLRAPPQPTVAWPDAAPDALEDHGTEAQRRLLRRDAATGYWYLKGRDVPMVLVSAESGPFFLDAHEVTFGEFEQRMAATPGPAKDFWDRCGIAYKRAVVPPGAQQRLARLLFACSVESALGCTVGLHDLARYPQTLLFGVSFEVADAYARAAYPRRLRQPEDSSSRMPAANASYGARPGGEERSYWPELKLAIPTYAEWRAAYQQQWGGRARLAYQKLDKGDLRLPPQTGDCPLPDLASDGDPQRGEIQGLRSGLAEWVRDVPATAGANAPYRVVGVSLFRPWSSEIEAGRVPFDGAHRYFADGVRVSPQGAKREEDAFGFRCVFRLDPYGDASEERQ